MRTWIQVKGNGDCFSVHISEDADVDKVRDAILAECPHSLKGFRRKDLIVYANEEIYERSLKWEDDALPLEGSQLIGNLGRTLHKALFVRKDPVFKLDAIKSPLGPEIDYFSAVTEEIIKTRPEDSKVEMISLEPITT